jgi:hypothetical protein
MPDSNTITALNQARSTGQPVPIQGGNGLVAYPNGSVGTPGGGFGSSRAATLPQPVVVNPASVLQRPSQITNQPVGATITAPSLPSLTSLTAPNSGVDLGPNIGTPVATAPVQPVQAPLNQANPNTTYVSPNTPQPAGTPPVVGQTGTQSGQPATPDLVVTARRYRLQHGLGTSDDTDALNAESLAAAQAGRTSFNPTLAAQYGQPLAAGVSGPRTDVVNALTLPTSATQAQQQPTQVAQNLLQQGVY